MCKTIAICNQKGGVSKTTTTINTGVVLTEMGKRVLIIDADPQGNFTMGVGIANPDELEYTLAGLLMNDIPKEKVFEKYIKKIYGFDFIPSNTELSSMENILLNTMSRTVLERFLRTYREKYDYILIDCPPSLSMMTINSLAACDEVIIPVQTQYYSAKGIELLIQTIIKVKKSLNSKLKIRGILLTMIDRRSKFQKGVVHTINNTYGEVIGVFKSIIPSSVKVSELQSKGIPISLIKSDNAGQGYVEFVKELLANE